MEASAGQGCPAVEGSVASDCDVGSPWVILRVDRLPWTQQWVSAWVAHWIAGVADEGCWWLCLGRGNLCDVEK